MGSSSTDSSSNRYTLTFWNPSKGYREKQYRWLHFCR